MSCRLVFVWRKTAHTTGGGSWEAYYILGTEDNSGKIDPSEFVRGPLSTVLHRQPYQLCASQPCPGFEQDEDFADCLKGMGDCGCSQNVKDLPTSNLQSMRQASNNYSYAATLTKTCTNSERGFDVPLVNCCSSAIAGCIPRPRHWCS